MSRESRYSYAQGAPVPESDKLHGNLEVMNPVRDRITNNLFFFCNEIAIHQGKEVDIYYSHGWGVSILLI